MPKHIVAIALVTDEELKRLGPHFSRAFPVDQTPCFGELLAAIDEADRELWRRRDAGKPDRLSRLETTQTIVLSPKL